MKGQIGLSPKSELLEHGRCQIFQFRKITIMRTESPRQLPNALNGIEVGAVRRKEVELKSRTMIVKPGLKNSGMMESRIIHDQDHPTVRPGVTQKQPQKSQECFSVEGRDRESDEAAVGRTDGPENGHRLPGGGMKKHRIGVFRGNPHDTPRPVLLKVTFIGKPQINVLSSGQFSEFFYMRPLPRGRPERSRPWVCADGIQVGGKASGTGGRRCRSDRGSSGDDSEVFRPRASGDILKALALAEDPGRRPGERLPIRPAADQSFLPLGFRRSRGPGSDGSNIGLFSGFAPRERRCRKSSCRSRKEERRGADGHSGILQTSGFRFGWRS